MATSLQQQLAAIQQTSTHQLDLKAQKAQHSKSLLFEPRDAASQSFDTIYQICNEGFNELSQLDARFLPFARNLFSEQSKNEDRTQMTAVENEELNKTVESFLGLVQGRLLLRPAMKAMEWVVRRFQAHEHSTETMLLTFLPYHTAHIFPTLLSILPEQLPASFRWLHPYVASLQSPPRHAILAAAISNQGFFSGFSQYVLQVARARHQSAILLGFWASITAQAVSGMIDTTRSGRDAIRRQREEDLLLRVLPILQSALSIRGAPELFLGTCMIMTILATKASLEDHVLDAMMQAIISAWTKETAEDGLMCVAVMAEEKQQIGLPKPVSQALLKQDGVYETLHSMSQRHRIGKLVSAIVVEAVRAGAAGEIELAKRLVSDGFVSAQNETFMLDTLLTQLLDAGKEKQGVIEFLRGVCDGDERVVVLRELAQKKGVSLKRHLPGLVAPSRLELDTSQESANEDEAMDIDEEPIDLSDQQLRSLLEALPNLDGELSSFLDPAKDVAFQAYAKVFEAVVFSERGLRQFLASRHLQNSKALKSPLLLSFLARAACSNISVLAKIRALDTATEKLRELSSKSKADYRMLLPYVLTALSDESQRVRRVAANLCSVMHMSYGATNEKIGSNLIAWGLGSLYGSVTSKLHDLSSADAYKFLTSAVIPVLDDCVLDGAHVSRALADSLKGAHSPGSQRASAPGAELKTSLRSEVCSFLASHATTTPALPARLTLLGIVARCGKVAGDARKNILTPFIKRWVATSSEDVAVACTAQEVPKAHLDKVVLSCLSHRSVEEIQTLKSIAEGGLQPRSEVQPIAFGQLGSLWPSLKGSSQIEVLDFLLDHALAVGGSEIVHAEALETLRSVRLSTEALVHMIESLPRGSDLHDQPSSAKKQRTSKNDSSQPRKVDQGALNAAIRRITLVLELTEASEPVQHPQLLKGLFNLLSELNSYKTLTGSQLIYLHGLLLGCLFSVVNGLKDSRSVDVDRSAIRADLIVECVRTTSSTQVHNTALLLTSSLATWAPELVLHSVMPLFTFMSTTLLRQSDEYSAHVTDQTVSRIVPPLAASLKKKGKDLASGAAELLLSFTAAFEHIPLHRRAGLFKHLVQTLGPKESLFAVIAMLIERYPQDVHAVPFAEDLLNAFPVQVQLQTVQQYLDLVFETRQSKRPLSDAILGFSEKNDEQREESTADLVAALATILDEDTALRKKVAKDFAKGDDHATNLHSLYSRILEQTMQLLRDSESGTRLRGEAEATLTAVLGLPPTNDFIESSAQLMQTGSDETRQQVFHSLESRVQTAKQGHATLQQTFLEVLPNCCVFIQSSQPVRTRQAAITCVDQIIERYGKLDRSAALEAATAVAGDAALGSEDDMLKITSVLCLASMVAVLEDDFISILPRVFDSIMGYADLAVDSKNVNYQLLDAVFSFAVSVLDHLPWMFSTQYLQHAFLTVGKAVARMEHDDVEIQMPDHFCSLAAKKIGAHELFTTIDQTWDAIAALGPIATVQHMQVLEAAVQHHKKAIVIRHAQALFGVLLKAFDLRRTHPDEEDSEEVFDLVDKIALDVVMKLNDATFRPFFIRLVEWATSDLPKSDYPGRVNRATSLYSFANSLFEQLKSIVTSYATYVLDDAAHWLQEINGQKAEDSSLLEMVLETLSSSFRHDQDDFWQAPQHFEAIMRPLLNQLENGGVFDVTAQVVPAITELASAAASPEHHKVMNTAIMQYMRHSNSAVRLAAVQCERAITERLNLDWLSLLPEMLPFISELQEDDDEEVERETLRWVRQIEEVTGESLEGMLQ
ncbi:hypothetical protein D0862_00451 [Hortaea werneckii]|uniref:U3 small nucleolar RNA-associated protein 10 n=1 Tax=Hortaea werneckii TaxID=91943 RepID=A0A3M7HYU8_HORWE|nr:hypothetical protein D0862_00451 [Hortaea werneckii]